MKLIKHSSTELVICDRPDIFLMLFLSIWSLFFIGIPSMMIIGFISEIGITRLDCIQIEPKQFTCERSNSRFLGWVPGKTTIYSQVKQATFKQTDGEVDSEGDERIDNWVSLLTSNGESPIFEDSIRYNGVKGSASEMQSLSDKINIQIEAGATRFSIIRDLRFRMSQLLFPVSFASLFVLTGFGILYWTIQIRITQFDRRFDRLEFKRYTLLGLRSMSVSFHEILEVRIDSSVNDGTTTHTLLLETESNKKLTLGHTTQLKRANTLKHAINSFLNFSQNK